MESRFICDPSSLPTTAASCNIIAFLLKYTDHAAFVVNDPHRMPSPWKQPTITNPTNGCLNFLVWFDYGDTGSSMGRIDALKNVTVTAISNAEVSWKVVQQYGEQGSDEPPLYWQIFPTELVTIDTAFALKITVEGVAVNNTAGLTTVYATGVSSIGSLGQMNVTVEKKSKPIFTQIVGCSHNDSPQHDLTFQVAPANDPQLQFTLDGRIVFSGQAVKVSDADLPHLLTIQDQQTGYQSEQEFPIDWLKLDKASRDTFQFSWQARLPADGCRYFLCGQAVDPSGSIKISVPKEQEVFSASLTVKDKDDTLLPFRWEMDEFALPVGSIKATAKKTANDGFLSVQELEQTGQTLFAAPYGSFDPPEPSPVPPVPIPPIRKRPVMVEWETKNATRISIEGEYRNIAASGKQEMQVAESQKQIRMEVATDNGFSREYTCDIVEES